MPMSTFTRGRRDASNRDDRLRQRCRSARVAGAPACAKRTPRPGSRVIGEPNRRSCRGQGVEGNDGVRASRCSRARDFAGTVEQVGAEVSRFEVGDDVFGFLTKPTVHEGAWAEYATVAEDGFVARKPSGLEFSEAAALPLAGVTALVSVDAVDPREGDTVLIVGADGGVGSYAVQLAAKRGATVIATAKPDDEQRLRDLGAAETIDYTREDIAAAVRAHHRDGVSALIDLVNQADGFAPLAELVRDGGRATSSLGAADIDGLARRSITATNVMANADPSVMGRLAELVAGGEV